MSVKKFDNTFKQIEKKSWNESSAVQPLNGDLLIQLHPLPTLRACEQKSPRP